MVRRWIDAWRGGDVAACSVLALCGLIAVAAAEVSWHWYISRAALPFAHTMLQYYLHVYPNGGHQSDIVDGFLPTMLIALWLVAVGRGACPFWWSVAISLLASAMVFGLLWVYAGLLPAVPAYAVSPHTPAIIFPIGVPGTAGMVLRYLQYLVPIAGMQVIVYFRWRKGGER